MKYLSRILFLSSLIAFTACSNDDEEMQDMNSLVGLWSVTVATCDDGVTTATFNGTSTTSNFTFAGENITSTVEFKDSGFFTSDGSYTQVMTVTSNGQTITQENDFSAFSTGGTWVQDGNTINFTNDGVEGAGQAEILELTETELQLRVSLNDSQSQQGIISETTGNVFYTLVRQ